MGKTIKANVKAKKDALKKKLAKKLKGGKVAKCAVVIALLALVGCSTATPASRLTAAKYGDIIIRLESCTNCSPRISLGDAAFASADSDGSTETQTATPTNTTDIKPETNVNTTGGRTAGILESMIGAFGAWLATPSGTAAAANAAKSGGACSGDCSYCPDGNCDTCTDCSP